MHLVPLQRGRRAQSRPITYRVARPATTTTAITNRTLLLRNLLYIARHSVGPSARLLARARWGCTSTTRCIARQRLVSSLASENLVSSLCFHKFSLYRCTPSPSSPRSRRCAAAPCQLCAPCAPRRAPTSVGLALFPTTLFLPCCNRQYGPCTRNA
jgi:hypothetical protein